MQHLTTNKITYKCGHYAVMPPYITTDIQAKNYKRWAKGQGLCLACLANKRVDEAYTYAQQNLYADLGGTFKQVRWALSTRQQKLTEIDLTQRTPTAFCQEPERRERLCLAHDRLARITQAAIWIGARNLMLEELIDFALREAA